MKRSISNQYDQLQEKLKGYVAMMNFRYINLCIKADPVSLIPVKVNVEGTEKNLEQVAMTAKKDDYRFWIVPKYDEDKDSICKGIAKVHPEFKQKEDTLKIEGISEDGEAYDVHYIELTMPDVDDKRYNALKDAVDVVYQECKTLMEAAVGKAKSEIAILSVGEPEEDIKGIKKVIDDLNEKCENHRDKLRDKKLQDIEDAYKQWLSIADLS
jgi:hypothetical protein